MSELFRICRFPFVFDWACVMSKPNRERNITNKFSDLTFPHQCQVTSLKPARNRMSIVNIFFRNYNITITLIDDVLTQLTPCERNKIAQQILFGPHFWPTILAIHIEIHVKSPLCESKAKKNIFSKLCVCASSFLLYYICPYLFVSAKIRTWFVRISSFGTLNTIQVIQKVLRSIRKKMRVWKYQNKRKKKVYARLFSLASTQIRSHYQKMKSWS